MSIPKNNLFFFWLALMTFFIPLKGIWGQDLTARRILEQAYSKVGSVENFQADISLYPSDQPLLPQAFGDLSSTPLIKGKFNYSMPRQFSLVFSLPNGTTLRISSDDGVNTSFIPSGKPETEASSDQASIAGPSMQAVSIVNPPTSLLLPLPLRFELTQNQIEQLSDDTVNGYACYVLLIKNSPLGDCTLWIDKQNYLIMKVSYNDQEGKRIEAIYQEFQSIGQGLLMPFNVEIFQDDRILFSAEIYSYQIIEENPPPTQPETTTSTSSTPETPITFHHETRPLVSPSQNLPPTSLRIPQITISDWLVFIFVILVLIYWGNRFINEMGAQATFSRELIIIDKEPGELLRLLRDAGYQGLEFTPELLTEERKLLNKPPRGVLPRAVIIAENSINHIKQYFFLLRAYLEEGGRVLIFPHSKEYSGNLPYTPEYFPYDPETIGRPTIIVKNAYMWSAFSLNQIASPYSPIMPSEVILRINGQWVNKELVILQNEVLGLNALMLGLVRIKKGEVMICQYHVLPTLLREGGKSNYSKILIDLISFLQRRPEDKSL